MTHRLSPFPQPPPDVPDERFADRRPPTAPVQDAPFPACRRWRHLAAPRRIPGARLVAAVDAALMVLALLAVLVGSNLDGMPHGLDGFLSMRITLKNVLLLAFFIAGAVVAFRLAGLYDAVRLRRWDSEARRVLAATSVVTAMGAVFPLTSQSGAVQFGSLLPFWALGSLMVLGGRRVRLRLTPRDRRRVIIVGSGPIGLRVCRELSTDVLTCYRLLGFVDDLASRHPILARRWLGPLDRLEDILAREHVDEVFIALPVRSHYPQIQETIRVCERVGVKANYRADIFESEIARARVQEAGALVELHVAPPNDWRIGVKRAVDIVGAVLAIVLLSPLMLAAAVAIAVTSPGPVIFAQVRYGLNRRRFRMLKFRTMVTGAEKLQASLEDRNEADGPVFKIAEDPRVTRVGRVLRRTSIDELPQLINVLRGEMSLVGPRPLPLRDVARFTRPADLRRFSVRPGLTCLWQVSGRSAVGFDEWIRMDLQYIDHWSLGLDFVLLSRTVPAVLRGSGAA